LNKLIRTTSSVALTGILTLAPVSTSAVTALADDTSDAQQQVEQAAAAYNQAAQRVEDVDAQIEENEQRIADLESKLPEQRERTADSIRALYKLTQQEQGLIDIVLSSTSFSELVSSIQYLSDIYVSNASEVQSLAAMEQDLYATRSSLDSARATAVEARDEKQQAQDAAIAARDAAIAAARQKSAAEAAEAEQAILNASASVGQEFTTASGQTAVVETPTSSQSFVEDASSSADADASAAASGTATTTNDTVGATSTETSATTETTTTGQQEQAQDQQQRQQDATESGSSDTASEGDGTGGESATTVTTVESSSDRDSFVSEWTSRINDYLEGSELEGTGRIFAEAAWDYGVDPRWSPAISCIESSKGDVCFLPYNAWGWMGQSFDSWEESIPAHVEYLSDMYGYTISLEAAYTYCPPTAENWYSTVLAQMESI